MKTVECRTADEVLIAVKAGDLAKIVAGAMIAMTLTGQPDAAIRVDNGAYFNVTLDSSQATIVTWGSSQATIETRGSSQATIETRGSSQATIVTLDSSQATIVTLDSSQATIETLDSSQATIVTLDSSQATIETLDSSQATIETRGSSQATIETRGSSQATIETRGSSQATIVTRGSSQATIETRGSSQATIETRGSSQATIVTWGSKSPLPDNITHIGGEEVATGTPELLRQVAAAALTSPDALKMNSWHCNTSHCLSGWATHLSGERGKMLEEKLGNHCAGLILLGRDAAAHFYDGADETDPSGPGHERAREWLRQFLPVEGE